MLCSRCVPLYHDIVNWLFIAKGLYSIIEKGRKPMFAIGTQFKTRGKHPRLCTVIDVLKTFNSKDELVQVRYVATHEFAGQLIADRDVCATTIKMGLISHPTATPTV
jgi:hypothetical protein